MRTLQASSAGEMLLLAPLTRAFTVRRISRRVGLAHGTTMQDLANDYAIALDEEFGEPVDVLGISTGGSIALQLAADRPELVSRLVVAGAACRLSEHGRRFQKRAAELSASGDRRGLSVMQAPDDTESPLGQRSPGDSDRSQAIVQAREAGCGIRGGSSRSRPQPRLSSVTYSLRLYYEQAPSGVRCVCTSWLPCTEQRQ
jgi:pimeloyl-ACP methyl ester carboxylesterase